MFVNSDHIHGVRGVRRQVPNRSCVCLDYTRLFNKVKSTSLNFKFFLPSTLKVKFDAVFT